MNSSQNPTLGEAATRFLASLSPDGREVSQPEVYRFVRWYGWERPFTELTAPNIASYAERLSLSDTDYKKKLELIRAFLIYAKKAGWAKSNLAIHLKTLKTKKGRPSFRSLSARGLPEAVSLTQQGYGELETELATLRDRRTQAIDEVRRAAADKDFRENAPLEAAKEQRGQLEGRIIELEEALKSATIIDEEPEVTLRVGIGDSFVLCDLASGEELRYMLVSPREVNPIKGKISIASPIGKAIIGRGQGEVVEVAAPVGELRYEIKQIEH